ncbi:hypothetical protein D3C81_1455680 [compost metagenome]
MSSGPVRAAGAGERMRASIAPTLHAGAASPCGAAWITTGDKPLLPIAACITGSSGVDTTTARAPQCPSMYA